MTEIKLRYYQEEAVKSTFDYINKGGKAGLVVIPTAGGKAFSICEIIKRILVNKSHVKILNLTHVKELIQQNYDSLKKLWPTAPAGIYSASVGFKQFQYPVVFGGIQSCYKKPELFGHIDLIIIDEAHLVSENAESMYGSFIKHLKKVNPKLVIIGFTATPYRLKMGYLTEGPIFDDVYYDISTMDSFVKLIDEGYLCDLIPYSTDMKYDLSEVKKIAGDFSEKSLDENINLEQVTRQVVAETMVRAKGRNKGIAFCVSINHAENMASLFSEAGLNAVSVNGAMGKTERSEVMQGFKSGKYNMLTNVGVATTGLDVPDIDYIVMSRPTQSPALHCLNMKTDVMNSKGEFVNYENINIGDELLTFDGKSFVTDIVKNKIVRPLDDGEILYEYDTPSLKFSMTENHDFLYRQRLFNKNYSDVRKQPLKNLNSKSNREVIISAQSLETKKIDWSNEALELYGLWLADGSFTGDKRGIIIYQSDAYPDHIKRIEFLLNKLNINAKCYKSDPFFKSNFKINRYVIYPKSKSKGSGFNHLWDISDFDKEIPEQLMNIPKEQFKYLLDGINLGDGAKFKSSSIGWTPKTKSISTGNLVFAERLQSLSIRNNYKCNIVESFQNKNTLYYLNICDKSTHKFEFKNLKRLNSEKQVWCLETSNGTLITRYKGVPLVTGNCQMMGRGMRIHPSKENTLVLDFAGNTERLGPINDPVVPMKEQKGEGEAPIRICMTEALKSLKSSTGELYKPEGCGAINHAAVRYCKVCENEFVDPEVKINNAVSTNELIKRKDVPKFEYYDVSRMAVTNHKSRAGNNVLKLTFICGDKYFDKYLDFTKTSRGLHPSLAFWNKFNFDKKPLDNEEAKGILEAYGNKPSKIRVWLNKPVRGKSKKVKDIMEVVFD